MLDESNHYYKLYKCKIIPTEIILLHKIELDKKEIADVLTALYKKLI